MAPKQEEYFPLMVEFQSEDEQTNKPRVETESSSLIGDSPPGPLTRRNRAWSWVVLAAGFFTLSVLDGVSYSFGVLLDPLILDLGVGRGGISMVGSLQTGVYSVSGLIASKLTSRYGTRTICGIGNIIAAVGLFLSSFSWNLPTLLTTYSVITGVGFGFMYIPAIVAVAEHFTERRSLALGICVCGTGFGTFVLAPLESIILNNLGWRSTLMMLGGICVMCLLLSSTMVPVLDLAEDEAAPVFYPGNKPLSLLRSVGCFVLGEELFYHPNLPTFLTVAAADALGTMALFIPFTYLPEVAESADILPTQAAFLLSAIGIASSVGRVLSGWIDDQPWSNPILLTGIVTLGAAFQPVFLTWCSSYPAFLVFSSLYGLLTGVWIAACSPVLLNILSLHLLTPAFGLMTAVQGVAALCGSPIAGLAVDYFQSTRIALLFSTVCLSFAATSFMFAYIQDRKSKHRMRYQELP